MVSYYFCHNVFFFIIFVDLGKMASNLSQNILSSNFFCLFHVGYPSLFNSKPPPSPFLLLEWVRSLYAWQWISACFGFFVTWFYTYFFQLSARCLLSWLPSIFPTLPCHSPHLLLGVEGKRKGLQCPLASLPWLCLLYSISPGTQPWLVLTSRFHPLNKNWFSYLLGCFLHFLEIFLLCRFCLLLACSLDLVMLVSILCNL